MDLFRMRCYLASLQGGELPNPKSLLAIASRPTKSTLGRLGIFSVSSFHALVSFAGKNHFDALFRAHLIHEPKRKTVIFNLMNRLFTHQRILNRLRLSGLIESYFAHKPEIVCSDLFQRRGCSQEALFVSDLQTAKERPFLLSQRP